MRVLRFEVIEVSFLLESIPDETKFVSLKQLEETKEIEKLLEGLTLKSKAGGFCQSWLEGLLAGPA